MLFEYTFNFKIKKLINLSLIQSIVSKELHLDRHCAHFHNLEVTLDSLLRFIFNKPTMYHTSNLYKELEMALLFPVIITSLV